MSTSKRGPGRRGLTCPAVQEADASVIVGGDGEGLVRVTHHLVDLGWAWKARREGTWGKSGRPGQRQEENDGPTALPPAQLSRRTGHRGLSCLGSRCFIWKTGTMPCRGGAEVREQPPTWAIHSANRPDG